jgi:hypothetical protein
MSQDQKAIVVNGLRKSYEPVIAVDDFRHGRPERIGEDHNDRVH